MNPAIPPPENLPSVGSARPGMILYYGCVRCQRNHFEGTAIFREHLFWQSKHSIQEMSREAYFRLIAQRN